MKKFSIMADPNSFNHFGGYGSNKSGKSNKQRPEQRFYVDEQNILTDDECEDDDEDAMMNLFLSY